MASLIHLFPGGLLIGAVQLDLQIFSDVDRPDSGITHMFERILHSFSLRIEHGTGHA